jgi:hypothetical protein
VVPYAWDLYGGCRVTGIPTVSTTDVFFYGVFLSQPIPLESEKVVC